MTAGEGDVLNPVEIEQFIRQLTNEIAKGVRVVSEAHKAMLDTNRRYDVAFARAFLNGTGSVDARKHQAQIDTEQQRLERDVADVAYSHAQRQMRALEGKLSAYQTISKSIQMMYGATGAGRGR